MSYINPIEILGLANATNVTSIDNDVIKKAKRKLFADIELSDDGLYNYFGIKLSKGECEMAINELDSIDFKEFYLYLANNKPLNEFLINGNNTVFNNFKHDSIFKLPDFVKFISSYFSPKFDFALFNAFESKNIDQTKAILKTDILISPLNVNTSFKTVTNSLQNKIEEIERITRDIKNEESIYDEDDIDEVVKIIKEYFPAELLNCLPQYFQSQILKIAKSINFLSNSIWDAFYTTQVPNDLTKYLLTLNISGLDKPIFEKNYQIIKKKNDERIEQEKFAPIIKKYASFIIESKVKIDDIKSHKTTISELKYWVDNAINVNALNSLDKIFTEIKTQIAITLKIVSVEVYNSFFDFDFSIYLLNKANEINNVEASAFTKTPINSLFIGVFKFR